MAPQGAMPLALFPRAARRELDRARRKLARHALQRRAPGASTSDIDHSITLNRNNTITWTNGQGVHITYAQVAGSTTTPAYTPPVNAYETITTVAASSGVPTVLLERAKKLGPRTGA